MLGIVPEEDGATRQAAQPNTYGNHDNPVSGNHQAKSWKLKWLPHTYTENYNPVRETCKSLLVQGIHLYSIMCTTKVWQLFFFIKR